MDIDPSSISGVVDSVVVFPMQGSKVLLEIHKDKYSGLYLKRENYETPENTVTKLFKGKFSLEYDEGLLQKCAQIHVSYVGTKHSKIINAYTAPEFIKETLCTDKLVDPRWFELDNVPYNNMSLFGSLWLKNVFEGEKLAVSILLGDYGRIVQQYSMGKLQ